MSSSVVVESAAYCKLVLHAAKHPASPVLGLLLGKQSGNSPGATVVVEAVPLFHTEALAPLLETGADLVDAYLSNDSQGLMIVGAYSASTSLQSSVPSHVAQRLCERADGPCQGAVLLQINNKRLEDPADHALQCFRRDSQSSKTFQRSVGLEVADGAVQALDRLLAVERQLDLTDMDDHFDNVSCDWRNLGLLSC
jgi:hypothetical protein